MKRLIMSLALCISCLFLTGCGYTYEYEEVTAIVKNKEVDSNAVYANGKYCGSSEEYSITVEYEELLISQTFHDSTLYEMYEVGDTISLYLEKAYNDEGHLVNVSLVY